MGFSLHCTKHPRRRVYLALSAIRKYNTFAEGDEAQIHKIAATFFCRQIFNNHYQIIHNALLSTLAYVIVLCPPPSPSRCCCYVLPPASKSALFYLMLLCPLLFVEMSFSPLCHSSEPEFVNGFKEPRNRFRQPDGPIRQRGSGPPGWESIGFTNSSSVLEL
jgi:hypothetical protein